MNIQPTKTSRALCPRYSPESEARPAEPLGQRTARCQDCGRVLRICDQPGCMGRNLPGSFHCRLCGQPLEPDWRELYWNKVAPRVVSERQPPAHTFKVGDELERVRLIATEAWVLLALDRRLLVMEPGPALRTVCEHRLEEDEKLVALRRGRGPLGWEILTSQRVLALDPKSRRWLESEVFDRARGELLWESGPLRAYYQPTRGSTLWLRTGDRLLLEDGGIVTEPAWLDAERWLCVGGGSRRIHYGSTSGGKTLPVPPLPGGGTLYAPVAEPEAGRVFISGREQVWWWKPGNKTLIELVSAAGGAMFSTPGRMTLLEGNRIRVFKGDLRPTWDSARAGESAFRRGPFPCDQAGGKILISHEQRGPESTAWLFDPADPQSRSKIALPGDLMAEPCLAPGGIATVHRLKENQRVALSWTEITTEKEVS